MEKIPVRLKAPADAPRNASFDLLERASATWVNEQRRGKEFLVGPAHSHPLPELFLSQRPLVLRVFTDGRINEEEGTRLWVKADVPHQILIPRDTGFTIYTCQQNLTKERRYNTLDELLV